MSRFLTTTALLLALAGCAPPETGPDPDMGMPPMDPTTSVDPTTMGPAQQITHPADEVVWAPGPPSLPDGAEFSVLEGDPSGEGIFVMRLRLPDGYEIPPHWHANFERVTVLEGTFYLGMGEAFDPDAATPLREGSFTVMPPETRHFAHFEGQTVLQITSIGPWEIHYVDPADDPRD